MPAEHVRTELTGLPEVAEIDLIRHYTRLSQMNHGVDTGPYPLGSCTMKYNPKVAETVAAMPGFQRLHPLQPDADRAGDARAALAPRTGACEITGMARATLQPPAGACGEMTGLLIMRAYHADRGATDAHQGADPRRRPRHEPGAAFGSPGSRRSACRRTPGVWSTSTRSRPLVDEQVAGLMLTNPNTLGLFEERIEEITAMLHDVGALVYYDGANLNAILGQCRPGDMGFDIVHINTHKTFATPHGGGGPGAGPVGVTEQLADYLPAPIVARDADGSLPLGS